MKIAAKILIGAAAAAGAGWTLVQNRQLMTSKYELEMKGLPAGFEGKRILLLSDLHKKRYGEGFSNLINSCAFLEPDLIFFTGDLFSRDEINLKPKLVLMQRLLKIAPVYYILGNHETDAPKRSEKLIADLRAEGVCVLRNESTEISFGEDSITLWGLELPRECYRSDSSLYRKLRPVTAELVEELLGRPDPDRKNFLLAHTPLPLKAYSEWGADAVFSGHVHGGVVRLPLIGGILSPERRFFPKYTRGLYSYNDTKLVLSAGLGKFRLNNPSQIILVTLKCADK